MVEDLIKEIKEKLKEFKTKKDKLRYLKRVLEETDNQGLKEIILELIEELEEEPLEEIVEDTPVVKQEPIKEKIVEEKVPEYRPRDRSRETLKTLDEEKPNVTYNSSGGNTNYVLSDVRPEGTRQSDLVEKLRIDLHRKHLLPSRGLVVDDVMKQEMRKEIKKYFNESISEDRLENYVELFTSFKNYESKDKNKEANEIEYHMIES